MTDGGRTAADAAADAVMLLFVIAAAMCVVTAGVAFAALVVA